MFKEVISYYVNNDSSVYCTLLDATKAFDRVEYCKLFRVLLDRKLPVACIQLLTNMYTRNVTRVSWNGVYSNRFLVKKRCTTRRCLSPILFCLYLDGLLAILTESNVSCFIGTWYFGELAYDDDIVLLAPSATAIRLMLKICDEYAEEFDIVFNAKKSK